MKTYITVLVLGAVLAVIAAKVAPHLRGPIKYDVPLGTLQKASPRMTNGAVKSPENSAWFAGLQVVLENGILQEDQHLDVVVQKSGKEIFSKRFESFDLIRSNSVKKNSFFLFLNGAEVPVPLRKALGYSTEFQLTIGVYNPKDTRFRVSARFIDDRILK